MGGERRRRRLRRTGRTPFDAAPEPEATTEATEEAGPQAEPTGRPGTPRAASPAAEAAPRTTGDDRSPRPHGGRAPRPGPPPQHRPSPADLADLTGAFALTAGVQDPEPAPASTASPAPTADHHHDHRFDDPAGERGLRGLVGGGSSQVNVVAAMRARDASRPTDDDLAAADADLPIVRRGWIPRDDLPRNH